MREAHCPPRLCAPALPGCHAVTHVRSVLTVVLYSFLFWTVFGHAPTWTGLGLFFDTYDNTGGACLCRSVSVILSLPSSP